jgi:hypothetical protein
MRHHHAYSEFVSAIFKVDPSEMMIFSIHDETKNCNASAFSERIRRKKALHSNSFLIQHNALVCIQQQIILISCKN